jgi:hypothetical protein
MELDRRIYSAYSRMYSICSADASPLEKRTFLLIFNKLKK